MTMYYGQEVTFLCKSVEIKKNLLKLKNYSFDLKNPCMHCLTTSIIVRLYHECFIFSEQCQKCKSS